MYSKSSNSAHLCPKKISHCMNPHCPTQKSPRGPIHKSQSPPEARKTQARNITSANLAISSEISSMTAFGCDCFWLRLLLAMTALGHGCFRP